MSAEVLAQEQEGTIDEALRIALRIIEERAELVSKMAEDSRNSARGAVAENYEERAAEYRRYADILRRTVIQSMSPPQPSEDEGGQGNAT